MAAVLIPRLAEDQGLDTCAVKLLAGLGPVIDKATQALRQDMAGFIIMIAHCQDADGGRNRRGQVLGKPV
jgi:hypothetical protein